MPPLPDPNGVFLNIPYDEEFRSLYIAYIVGLCQLDLIPHLASELAGGGRRLDKIFHLIQSCRYSVHDLSRVEVSVAQAATPRFNMPLELGMTITWQILNPSLHDWFVLESEPFRLQRSLSDLNGTDPCIHYGAVEGVLRELCNAFRRDRSPTLADILAVYRFVESSLKSILSRNGTNNPFDRSVFMELCRLSIYLANTPRRTKRAIRRLWLQPSAYSIQDLAGSRCCVRLLLVCLRHDLPLSAIRRGCPMDRSRDGRSPATRRERAISGARAGR